MNGRACSLVRASAVRVCTVFVRGLGMAVCFLCGTVRLRTAYRGGMCVQSLNCSLSTTLSTCVHAVRCVYVRHGVRLGRPHVVYLVHVCVYVCMYGDLHV